MPATVATSAEKRHCRLQIFKQMADSLVSGRTPNGFREEGTKKMARSRLGTHRADAGSFAEIARDEIRSENFEEYDGEIEDTLDEDDDFDADEDIAFLGEEYDVLELDDVLELCNLDKRDPFRH